MMMSDAITCPTCGAENVCGCSACLKRRVSTDTGYTWSMDDSGDNLRCGKCGRWSYHDRWLNKYGQTLEEQAKLWQQYAKEPRDE